MTLQALLREVIDLGLISSAHDCADGGLAVALAESCLLGGIGAVVHIDAVAPAREGARMPLRHDLAVFGEAPTRVVASCRPEHVLPVRQLCEEAGVPCAVMGSVGGDSLRVQLGGELMEVTLLALEDAYEGGLPQALGRD